MNTYQEQMRQQGFIPVEQASLDARVGFIRRTYAHLAGAITLFVILAGAMLHLGVAEMFVRALSVSPYLWLGVLLGFTGLGWVADWWARSMESKPLQYAGLGLYVVLEALIFQPLLFMAQVYTGGNEVTMIAGGMTLLVFAGLTVAVFVTKQDFSFLRTALVAGGMIAMGVIVFAIIFGFPLGMWFSVLMIGFASLAVLYYTSGVMRDYRTDQHVAASLALFSAVAMLFFYILRLLIQLTGD